MTTLSALLSVGTAKFNALRARGGVPHEHAGATLSQLFFAKANLSGLDLSNAELDECTVSDTDFRGADLSGAFIHGGRYERCDFRQANLEGASFEQVEFVECDFTGAKGLASLELTDVIGLGVASPDAPALQEEPRFVPGHVAVNDALERAIEAQPDDESRWLVYGDWLQGEGDLRGELVTRQHRGDGFAAFVDDHLEQLFPTCADEVRGGGQVPELVPEWRHGFVHGVTLSSPNPERRVDLADLARRVLPLPVCRFLRRLSFGLNPGVQLYGEGDQANDYAPLVQALIAEPLLARVTHLELGVQEPELDEFGAPEPLLPFGDLSALWRHVPHLRRLKVKGGGDGVLGELSLPELREVSFDFTGLESALFDEIVAARLPKLERFELFGDQYLDLPPLLHVLAASPLTHFAMPHSDRLLPVLTALVASPLLRRLRVLDLRNSELEGNAFEFLRTHIAAFRHLERLDLTNAVDPHEEEALARLGDFIVLKAPEDTRPLEETSPFEEDWDEHEDPEAPLEVVAANADLDIPDEHGD